MVEKATHNRAVSLKNEIYKFIAINQNFIYTNILF